MIYIRPERRTERTYFFAKPVVEGQCCIKNLTPEPCALRLRSDGNAVLTPLSEEIT